MSVEPSSAGHRCLLGLRLWTHSWENGEGNRAWLQVGEMGVGTGVGTGEEATPHQPLAGGQVLQGTSAGLQGGVFLALAHEVQVGADGV